MKRFEVGIDYDSSYVLAPIDSLIQSMGRLPRKPVCISLPCVATWLSEVFNSRIELKELDQKYLEWEISFGERKARLTYYIKVIEGVTSKLKRKVKTEKIVKVLKAIGAYEFIKWLF